MRRSRRMPCHDTRTDDRVTAGAVELRWPGSQSALPSSGGCGTHKRLRSAAADSMTTAKILVAVGVALLAACDRSDTSREQIDAVISEGRDRASTRVIKDPARQPHPDDANPLRRVFCDLEIRELFFGKSQTRGDWRAWRPCSQQANGIPVAAADQGMLTRCAALSADLLAKAHAAGVSDATAADVMDPQLSGARRGVPSR